MKKKAKIEETHGHDKFSLKNYGPSKALETTQHVQFSIYLYLKVLQSKYLYYNNNKPSQVANPTWLQVYWT